MAMPMHADDSGDDSCEEPSVIPQYDATPTCNHAWCHELACQTTHCGVDAAHLHRHCRVTSPFQVIRISVWTPFFGPHTFDFPTGHSLAEFNFLLHEAGYHANQCTLHVAFDTLPTCLDLVAVPRGPQRWWIVRDGLARELLRPVSPWVESDGRRILTVNSHGQAQGLSHSEEAGRLHLLPNGVRATITVPFSRITGSLVSGSLALVEHAVGATVMASMAPTMTKGLFFVVVHFSLQGVAAMQNNLALRAAQEQNTSGWQHPAPTVVPSITRIWTSTLAAPTVIAYNACPDPVAMARSVANTARGLAPEGDFVWTTPRTVQGVAHLLHVPSGSAPPMVYWLLHYRGRATVLGSPRAVFDWQSVGQFAAEEFGHAFFAQGLFAAWHNGRSIAFGSQVPAPAHGTIVTLVRTAPTSTAGLTAWDTPAEFPAAFHFEYDICRGPGGESPLAGNVCLHVGPSGPIDSPAGEARSIHAQGPGRPARPSASPAPALVRQVNEVSHQLNVLMARLESAGVLPSTDTEVAPEGPVFQGANPRPPNATSVDSASPRSSLTWTCVGAIVLAHRWPTFFGVGLLLFAGSGKAWATDSSEEAEHPPSSPDLADVAPPTPEGDLIGPDNNAGALLRPSDDPGASTAAPGDGVLTEVSGFDSRLIPCLQQRTIAFLHGVGEDHHGPRPFLPEGCPLVIHNPFTCSAQCPVLSPLIGTGFAFRLFLQDYAGRRGWQPIVPVLPQPNDQAVHLIPAAADPALVSVVLRTPSVLHPTCLQRALPVGPSRSITLAGRFGRLREPYPLQRPRERPVYLRDGDCLQLDQGPFGPPPPTPVRSCSSRLHFGFGLMVLARAPLRALALIALVSTAGSMQVVPSRQGLSSREGLPVRRYPWRYIASDRQLSDVNVNGRVRCTLLCPMTGPQGVHEVPAAASIASVLQHYQQTKGFWIRDLIPVWPSPRWDQLVLVPDVDPFRRCVCIVLCEGGQCRTLLLPERCEHRVLFNMLNYLAHREFRAFGLPPALRAAVTRSPRREIVLRPADVFTARGVRQPVTSEDPVVSLLQWDHLQWASPFVLETGCHAAFWHPAINRPVIHWVTAGARWNPDMLTFEGEFADTCLGSWVPVMWQPATHPHFIQASTRPGRVHILHESRDGLFPLFFSSRTSRAEVAEELHTLPEYIEVPAATIDDYHGPLTLRDGDVVLDLYMYDEPHFATWDVLHSSSFGVSIRFLMCGLMGHVTRIAAGMCFLQAAGATRGSTSRSSHSRSRSVSPDRLSPRAGAWRPEHPQPMSEVLNTGTGHCNVVSPFHGVGPPSHFYRDTLGSSLDQALKDFCGRWCSFHVLQAPLLERRPMMLLPGGLPDLATVLVLTADQLQAVLIPRRFSARELTSHLRRVMRSAGTTLRLPPALRHHEALPSMCLHLRDGDTCSWTLDFDNPLHREAPMPRFRYLSWLPHHNAWHSGFTVRHGGWVWVWMSEVHPDHQCERHWVPPGSQWSPGSLQFLRPRCAPCSERWIPTTYNEDGQCHFVRQSLPGEARVLLHRPYSGDHPDCVSVGPEQGLCYAPEGWTLAPSLRRRAGNAALRDGDVLIPVTSAGHRPSLALAAVPLMLLHGPLRSLGFLAWIGGLPVAAMLTTDEGRTGSPTCVGKFPWRVAYADRALHETVNDRHRCRLLSPFAVHSNQTFVAGPDDTVEEVRLALTGAEPAWSFDIMPVWPAPSPSELTWVPVAPSAALACVLVVTPDWHLPMLLPQRADLNWVLAYLRSVSPGPVHSIRAPIPAQHYGTSPNEAIRWRDGDLILAFPTDFEFSALDMPSFRTAFTESTAAFVRHTALWALDFYVDQPLNVVLWRPGRRPVSTKIPSPVLWCASEKQFRGQFPHRYPGRWVPLAWAYSDIPHLCLCPEAEELRTIIIETFQQDRLVGQCHVVHACADANTCRILVDQIDAPCMLLGATRDKEWSELRNGDIAIWVPVRPALNDQETHVLLAPALQDLVTVFVVGAPAPRALILPRSLSLPTLLEILQPSFGSDVQVAANSARLTHRHQEVCFRDGDCLRVTRLLWAPSLVPTLRTSFTHPRNALREGLWGMALTVPGPGRCLLWRCPGVLHRSINFAGTQHWDPYQGRLLPCMGDEAESWWPIFDHRLPAHTLAFHPVAQAQQHERLALTLDEESVTLRDVSFAPSFHSWSKRTVGMLCLLLCHSLQGIRPRDPWPRSIFWSSLLIVLCYLAAWGAPAWERVNPQEWDLDLTDVCQLQADLHQGWWLHGLADELPRSLPLSYHAAWAADLPFGVGPPDSLLIATDGSGAGQGAWAFVAWGHCRYGWRRLGWAAASLPGTPWLPDGSSHPFLAQRSYLAELAALQAAGHWCVAMCDLWRLRTGRMPKSVTVAVDNSAALQVVSGHGAAMATPARWARAVWQPVQTRLTTHFRHVHSHQGTYVNTLVDALATCASDGSLDDWLRLPSFQRSSHLTTTLLEWLWIIPNAALIHGRPIFRFPLGEAQWVPPVAPSGTDGVEPDTEAHPVTSSFQVITANIQSIKDVCPNPFNPSGHGARRQYLYKQLGDITADVVCLQETRAPPGRWATGGWLTWRSGSLKGQYGCEIWLRPSQVQPPLTLDACRILAASPRYIVITCTDPRCPLTICSAHAPHADRPHTEAQQFWAELRGVLQRVPPSRALVVGIDANADFCAQDPSECLIGPLLAQHEPTSNDEFLYEFATSLALEAPGTHPDIQVGPGWSWMHTGGRQKRLDHLLFSSGSWTHKQACQAWDFDIVNTQRDHVALRVHTEVSVRAHQPHRPPQRRCTGKELLDGGQQIWSSLPDDLTSGRACGTIVHSLQQQYQGWVDLLPRKMPVQPKQPYIQEATLQWLTQLRDWRCQLRHARESLKAAARALVLARWHRRLRPLRASRRVAHHNQRMFVAALTEQESQLQQQAHAFARHDKQQHFLSLTGSAAEHWHQHGRPMEAIVKLRWASRRAAERRQVYAAGGFAIELELEEQFRAQEAAIRTPREQLPTVVQTWLETPAPACATALPSLLDMEVACRRQAINKAPGPDGIRNELWKGHPVQAGRWLWAITSRIALSGREPFQFKAAVYCALYKKGPAALPQNYRAIALMNGVAKIWHGHLRQSIGRRVLHGYDRTQLGGKPGIPVSFAVAAYRSAIDLCVQANHSTATLFIDVQAAYYEVSRRLIFEGDDLSQGDAIARSDAWHLAALTEQLANSGALELLGVPQEERALLQDCVACSHWHLAGSDRVFVASRGSRPGDGLADILFGALFAIALRHIRRACQEAGIALQAAGDFIGLHGDVLPLGWADDLAMLADFPTPQVLLDQLPTFAGIVLSTLELLRFRINLGPSKTELLLDIRGPDAKRVRGELMAPPAILSLASGHCIRISPEYRYLGVITSPRDTGRRDTELSAQRAHAALSHAKGLMVCSTLPWRLKQAWVAGRVLPAAYATLCTSLATSGRATAPLQGFFERVSRQMSDSWQHGHILSRPVLVLLLGLSTPEDACCIARARLVLQLLNRDAGHVFELVDAAWNRATPWAQLLVEACQEVSRALPTSCPLAEVTLQFLRTRNSQMLRACRHLSRFGSAYRALTALWSEIAEPKVIKVIGPREPHRCHLCGASLPSKHALAAHVHRKHSVVNWLTQFTHGTVCLWCNVQQHSTDRIKYHLGRSPMCMHGLRVVVGHAYVYGSGTKRKGQRGHRGLPPIRLPGPINATPAQRRAAEEGRICTEDELRQERLRVLGVGDVYQWPHEPSDAAASGDGTVGTTASDLPQLPVSHPGFPDTEGEPHGLHGRDSSPEAFTHLLVETDTPGESGDTARSDTLPPLVSPLWHALLHRRGYWCLPRTWHRMWGLWWTLQSLHPWTHAAKRGFRLLRTALESREPGPSRGPPPAVTTLLAATVTFRMISAHVQRGAAMYIHGTPSSVGIALWRRLMPGAVTRTVVSSRGPVFCACHPSCVDLVVRRLSSSGMPEAWSVDELRLRPSMVFRSSASALLSSEL
ncbi:unnamed protein product [Symbiodinium sp. CCMP2592]|nr:unnamed protein product [Symbiodinium sp. CCMP2592]